MIKRIHHIGIAVKDLADARHFFEENFRLSSHTRESFGELDFSFIPLEGTAIELLQSTTDSGVIAKFIQKKGTGVHHITFEVDDIQGEFERMTKLGVVFHAEPAEAGSVTAAIFDDTCGNLIQIYQL